MIGAADAAPFFARSTAGRRPPSPRDTRRAANALRSSRRARLIAPRTLGEETGSTIKHSIDAETAERAVAAAGKKGDRAQAQDVHRRL